MVTVREVDANKLNTRLKEELKKVAEIAPPKWSLFVKSGVHRERPPLQSDFWYIRAASLLRRIYLDGPVGVSKLRSFYGGRKEFGHMPAHFRKASGNILRKILQELETAGMVEKAKGGRRITAKGQKFLDSIANEVRKNG